MTSLHDFGFPRPQGIYAHGTRQNYRTGCRCTPCRSANACYEALRVQARAHGQPVWAAPDMARRKLRMLQGIGVGYRQAARLAGVSVRTVLRIRRGQAQRIHADIERAIVGIEHPSLARGVYVNGYETRHYVESLVREDFKKTWLAAKLGLRGGRLRIGHIVRAATALKVRQLHRDLTAE